MSISYSNTGVCKLACLLAKSSLLSLCSFIGARPCSYVYTCCLWLLLHDSGRVAQLQQRSITAWSFAEKNSQSYFNKNISLYNHNAVMKLRKFQIDTILYLTYSPYSNFVPSQYSDLSFSFAWLFPYDQIQVKWFRQDVCIRWVFLCVSHWEARDAHLSHYWWC